MARSEHAEDISQHIHKVIFSQEEIEQRVAELGRAISDEYAGRHPVLVGVLNGVVMFMADLLRYISVPVEVDFMAISSYDAGSTTHGVRITKDLDHSITDRHVLFIEDVIDTGLTLDYLLRTLQTRRPKSIETCVLFDRPYRRLIEIPLRYRGFELPDQFVVGYGLDADGYYRNVPLVGLLAADVEPSPD